MFSAENIVVLGAGKSGVGAAVLAQKKEKCICFDASSITLEYKSILITMILNGKKMVTVIYTRKAESVIISPEFHLLPICSKDIFFRNSHNFRN